MSSYSPPSVKLKDRYLSTITEPLSGNRPVSKLAAIAHPRTRRVYLPGTIILTVVLAVTFWVHWQGFSGWPGLINNDEGVYVEQAWAVQFQHSLSPYTYMYDHPMVGWLTIAAYNIVTGAIHRAPTSIIAGREAMLVAHMVSSLFLYLLARRLRLRPLAAGAAVLLFSLSPLALQFQRMVFLDNLAVMWTIIALWALASPWRSCPSAALAGGCFALAVLSKETAILLLPGVMLMMWDHRDQRNAKMRSAFFWSPFILVLVAYPLYATIKNELFPGPGHVSLIETIQWQLLNRASSGSLLDPTSATFAAAMNWVHLDPILLGLGIALVPVGLCIKRYRAVAVSLAVLVLMLMRNQYLPFAYPTAMFPFAALLLAGTGDWLWSYWKITDTPLLQRLPSRLRQVARLTPRMAVISLGLVLVLVAVPSVWGSGLNLAMSATTDTTIREATDYTLAHVPGNVILVADNDVWTDLKLGGRTVVPKFNLDLDPAIRKTLKHGYRSIAYLLLTGPTDDKRLLSEGLPTVSQAYKHSELVRSFGNGSITLRRVVDFQPN